MKTHLINHSLSLVAALIIFSIFMTGCTGTKSKIPANGENIITEAKLLRIIPDEVGELVEIVNPWDTTRLIGCYYLTGQTNVEAPQGAILLNVPLERSAVFGTVHLAPIEELGALDEVAAVADADYIGSETVKKLLKSGHITDVGAAMSPSLEKIVAVRPDAILLSPYENSGHGVLDNAGITLIEMADYMEETPLGRAEWIKFIGRLYGRGSQADSLYNAVKEEYNRIKAVSSQLKNKPKVLTEQLTEGYWFVPGGKSYMARLITDAGAEYPWANTNSAGSLQLDFSAVLARASDADFWIIRTYGYDLTLDKLQRDYSLNTRIKAFNTGGVYACNTADVPLFDEFPFHPERLLTDYAAIFSGNTEKGLHYFKQVQ